MTNLTQLKPDGLLHRMKKGDLLISDGATGTWLHMHGQEQEGSPQDIQQSNGELNKRMSEENFYSEYDNVLKRS